LKNIKENLKPWKKKQWLKGVVAKNPCIPRPIYRQALTTKGMGLGGCKFKHLICPSFELIYIVKYQACDSIDAPN
jgi:hypothetical protein